MSTAIAKVGGGFAIAPANMGELFQFAKMLAESDLVPKDYINKPGNCMVAMQMGAELGLSPMQAIQNIAVVNGRPSLWGDALLAVCQAHPTWRGKEETFDGTTAICKVRRLQPSGSIEETVGEFSVEDAKKAKLWEKQGPWQQYTKRMLKMRARGFALRDAFADVLRGIHSAEEAMDIPPEVRAEVVSSKPVSEPKPAPKQERKSTPPQVSQTAVLFKGKDPEWAGKPVDSAPNDVIAKYISVIDATIRNPDFAQRKREYTAHLKEVEAIYEVRLAAERERNASKPIEAPADPIAEGLQAEIDKREQHHAEQDGERAAAGMDGWGLNS